MLTLDAAWQALTDDEPKTPIYDLDGSLSTHIMVLPMSSPGPTTEPVYDDLPTDEERPRGHAAKPARHRRENAPPPPHRKGRGPRKMIVRYEDFARVFGVKVATVRQWVWSGVLDPADPLGSAVALLKMKRGR